MLQSKQAVFAVFLLFLPGLVATENTTELAATSLRGSSKGPGCLDASGKALDFFYSFKYPNGWDYAFMDAKHKLAKEDTPLGKGKSAIEKTMDQLYKDTSKYSYAMWNDEPPSKSKVGKPKAHAKGMIAMGKSQGFWLTHSIPNFPKAAKSAKSSKSSFASSGTASNKYGQSFLCITFDVKDIDKIVEMFETDWMVIYDSADHAEIGGSFADWATGGDHADAKDKKTQHHRAAH